MLKQQIVVIGLGRFGAAVGRALYEQGHDVLGIDRDEERVQELLPQLTHAARADASDRAALAELAVGDFDSAIIGIADNMEASLLATMAVKDLGVRFIVAKAESEQHARILTRIGADEVVFPERDMGFRLSRRFATPTIVDHLEIVPGFGIWKLTPDSKLVGRSIAEAGLAERDGLTLLGIARGSSVRLYPAGDDQILAGDFLVIAGPDDRLGRLHR